MTSQSSGVDRIRRTLARYAHVHDGRDSVGYARLFTERGSYTNSSGETFVGRAAIEAHMAAIYRQRPVDHTQKHVFTNVLIDLDGDTAEAISDVITYERTAHTSWELRLVGRAVDRLQRVGDEWLFSDRRIERS